MGLMARIRSRLEESLLTTSVAKGTASSDAVTIAAPQGVITSETKSTVPGSNFDITLTNSLISPGDIVVAEAEVSAGGAGTPKVTVVTVNTNGGSVVIRVVNKHASAAFNGPIRIGFKVIK